MNNSSEKKKKRAAVIIIIILILLVAVSYIIRLVISGDEKQQLNTGSPLRASDSAGHTDRPDTAVETIKDWSPPRFTARRRERNRMVDVIRSYGLRDKKVLQAMAKVPRHEFVLKKYQSRAYADTPLPIGHGQTIAQPYIVAEMTRQLKLKPDSRVLEIGTGSGYQAAVLSEFTPYVYTIEIIDELAASANKKLRMN